MLEDELSLIWKNVDVLHTSSLDVDLNHAEPMNHWILDASNILNFPPRGILKIGGGNFGIFSKVDHTVPN